MDKKLNELEHCLRDLLVEHEQLLGLVRRKLEAMKLSSPELINDCCLRENECVQKIGDTEKHRQKVVGELTLIMQPNATEPLNLQQIGEALPEPRRGVILVLRAKLRDLMAQIKKENNVADQATKGLLGHVRGVMQMVRQAASGAGTYSRKGIEVKTSVPASSFSLTG